VCFAFGTILVVKPEDIEKAKTWTFDAVEAGDESSYRFVTQEAYKAQLKVNQTTYETLLTQWTSHKDVINAAYMILVNHGYPLPGGPGADSWPILLAPQTSKPDPLNPDQALLGIAFPVLDGPNRIIFTLASAIEKSQINGPHAVGRECRRADCMIPRPVAILFADLTAPVLELEDLSPPPRADVSGDEKKE
jgi:hypothetical protein